MLSEEAPVAALFVAPDAGHDCAIYVRPQPREAVFWLEPLDPGAVLVGGEPPSSVEHDGIRFDRVRRLPLRPKRIGVGAPDVGDAVVLAEYASAGSERLLVMRSTLGHVARVSRRGARAVARTRSSPRATRRSATTETPSQSARMRESIASTTSCGALLPSRCSSAVEREVAARRRAPRFRAVGARRVRGLHARAPSPARRCARGAGPSPSSRPRRARAAARARARRPPRARASRSGRAPRSPRDRRDARPPRRCRPRAAPPRARAPARRRAPRGSTRRRRRAAARSGRASCARGSSGSSASGWDVSRMKCVRAPGSSSVLSSAFAAGHRQLLDAPHDEDLRAPLVRRIRRARQDERADLIDRDVLRLRRAPADGLRRIETALDDDDVRMDRAPLLVARHRAQARRAGAAREEARRPARRRRARRSPRPRFSQTSACASPNAASSLPTPSGPANRYAWWTRPVSSARSIVRRAASCARTWERRGSAIDCGVRGVDAVASTAGPRPGAATCASSRRAPSRAAAARDRARSRRWPRAHRRRAAP